MDLLTRPIKAGSVNAITPGRALCQEPKGLW